MLCFSFTNWFTAMLEVALLVVNSCLNKANETSGPRWALLVLGFTRNCSCNSLSAASEVIGKISWLLMQLAAGARHTLASSDDTLNTLVLSDSSQRKKMRPYETKSHWAGVAVLPGSFREQLFFHAVRGSMPTGNKFMHELSVNRLCNMITNCAPRVLRHNNVARRCNYNYNPTI